jgi:hypothetical protein
MLKYRLNNAVLYDVTPYSVVYIYRRFGGMYCLHLQDRRVRQASNQYVLLATQPRLTHHHLMPRSRKRGSIHPPPIRLHGIVLN